MLPRDAVLRPVGGTGKVFWAAGKNWDIVRDGLTDESLALMGQWRLEVTPGNARQKDNFLHVIQVGGQGLEQMDEVKLIEENGRCGVTVQSGKQTWDVVFNSVGVLGGHISRTGRGRRISRNLAAGVQKQVGIAARTF
jgi:hypothetical protein